MKLPFCCLWEFEVPAAADAEFRQHYDANGTWAALFRRHPAYVDTALLQDCSRPGHYVTIDRWQSAAAYRSFRQQFAEQYAALDTACAGLTSRETRLGSLRQHANAADC